MEGVGQVPPEGDERADALLCSTLGIVLFLVPCPGVHSNEQATPCTPCSCWEARLDQPAKPGTWGCPRKKTICRKNVTKCPLNQ